MAIGSLGILVTNFSPKGKRFGCPYSFYYLTWNSALSFSEISRQVRALTHSPRYAAFAAAQQSLEIVSFGCTSRN